jgi:Ca2+-binding EF-hand superfamily protein
MADVVGYTRSKLVAENEIRQAAQAGLPTAIYRPGLVLGHRRTGAFADTEMSIRLIRGAVTVSSAPATDCAVPATPVDHLAQAVAVLSTTPEALGGAWHPNAPLSIADIFGHARSLGYPLPERPVDRWRQALLDRADDLSAYLVLAAWELVQYILAVTERLRPPALDCTRTYEVLSEHGVRPPSLDSALFHTIIHRVGRDGLIPPIPSVSMQTMESTKEAPRDRDQRLRKSFGFFDADKDGDIEYDDVLAMAARITSAFGVRPGSAKGIVLSNAFEIFWRELLDAVDLDDDRRITEEEYLSGMVGAFAEKDGGFDRGLRPVIAAILVISDSDDDGMLNREEFQRVEAAMGNPSSDAGEAFDKLDRDNSATLTVEELIDAAREFHTGTDPAAPGNWLFGSV